jgi:uncharacterized metal-binding protein YceD (DUF177 family)
MIKNEAFRIYVDRLKDHEQKIQETFNPDFLGIEEEDLHFSKPVTVSGEAYLATDELVLHLKIDTVAEMPCSMCNDRVEVPIKIDNFYHSVPLSEVKKGIYDFSHDIRDEILISVPDFVECHEGTCPNRKEMEDTYRPFADL